MAQKNSEFVVPRAGGEGRDIDLFWCWLGEILTSAREKRHHIYILNLELGSLWGGFVATGGQYG